MPDQCLNPLQNFTAPALGNRSPKAGISRFPCRKAQRPLIKAIVDVMRPAPGQTIHDPGCGTGGFLMIAHDYVSQHYELDLSQKKYLKLKALSGNELVDSVARLCVMNLYLHGIGGDDCPIDGGGTA